MEAREVHLDHQTLEALEELFDSKEIRRKLVQHYMELAEVYVEVIAESPIEKPSLDEFRGIIFETFTINIARHLFRMKGSILYNLTVAEQEGKTYSQIQEMVTHCMMDYEKELADMLKVDPIRDFYPYQMQAVKEVRR
jgi:hypothetical protein